MVMNITVSSRFKAPSIKVLTGDPELYHGSKGPPCRGSTSSPPTFPRNILRNLLSCFLPLFIFFPELSLYNCPISGTLTAKTLLAASVINLFLHIWFSDWNTTLNSNYQSLDNLSNSLFVSLPTTSTTTSSSTFRQPLRRSLRQPLLQPF